MSDFDKAVAIGLNVVGCLCLIVYRHHPHEAWLFASAVNCGCSAAMIWLGGKR